MKLENYDDFIRILLTSGFSLGGGKAEGIFSIVNHDWYAPNPLDPIQWHTGDIQTDPWEWRYRVLKEHNDIAYSKPFFKKSGFITEAFYPYFLRLRRTDADFEAAYFNGKISHIAKRIYDVVQDNPELQSHEIKRMAGFDKTEKSKFDAAVVELQMGLYITISGASKKRSVRGEEFGWDVSELSTTEYFWRHSDVFARASACTEAEAFEEIRVRVLDLNPLADEKKIYKFAYGK